MPIDLTDIKKIYCIGIKGSGMVALAEILHSYKIKIIGSDTKEKFFTEAVLDRLGIKYFEGFDPENIPADADLILYSTSYNENNNVEIKYARENNLSMISYPEMLAELFNQKYGIAVCGTHGKTTTSAMLAHILKIAEVNPTAVVGSKVLNWGGNALVGQGEFFVAETDEYQNKLALYDPKAAIFTSCDFDHPDYFKDFSEYKKVFEDFVARIPKESFLIVYGDSVDTLEIAKSARCNVLTYGFGNDVDFKISNPSSVPCSMFHVSSLGDFEIQLTGKHNILNATAAIAVCHKLGIDMEKVREGLKDFQGTARRFEIVGERNEALLIDDYAHHPEEIKATLAAARQKFPNKNILAVFHPHTFSRTQALLSEFSQSFSDANKVIVLDIYGSARETQGGVSSKELVDLINKYDRAKAEYIPTIDEVVEFLKDKIGEDDVVLTMGAGNVWEVTKKLKE